MAKYRKLITAVVGAVGLAITEGVVPGVASRYVAIGVAFLTALGVYTVPNGQ